MSKVKEHMDTQAETKQMRRMNAIINSMTREERRNHAILTVQRKSRIAKGSGVSVPEVNAMLNQFMQMKKMMGMMSKPGKMGKLGQMFKKVGLGDFANAMLPGAGGGGGMPNDMDPRQLQEIIAQNGGQIPPELRAQLGMGAPAGAGSVSRPKRDRKKQKAKRKAGRKKKR
jgi:hypothetical protein